MSSKGNNANDDRKTNPTNKLKKLVTSLILKAQRESDLTTDTKINSLNDKIDTVSSTVLSNLTTQIIPRLTVDQLKTLFRDLLLNKDPTVTSQLKALIVSVMKSEEVCVSITETIISEVNNLSAPNLKKMIYGVILPDINQAIAEHDDLAFSFEVDDDGDLHLTRTSVPLDGDDAISVDDSSEDLSATKDDAGVTTQHTGKRKARAAKEAVAGHFGEYDDEGEESDDSAGWQRAVEDFYDNASPKRKTKAPPAASKPPAKSNFKSPPKGVVNRIQTIASHVSKYQVKFTVGAIKLSHQDLVFLATQTYSYANKHCRLHNLKFDVLQQLTQWLPKEVEKRSGRTMSAKELHLMTHSSFTTGDARTAYMEQK